MRASLPTVAALLALAAPRVSSAQPDDAPLPGEATEDAEVDTDRAYRGRFWLDLGFYSGDETPEVPPGTTVTHSTANDLTVTAGGLYRLAGAPVALEARAGMVAFFRSIEDADTQSSLRLANPLLAAYYADRFGRLEVRAGAGLALPLASIPSGTSEAAVEDATLALAAYAYAAALHGLWDFYAWVPDHVTLLLPTAAVEVRVDPHVRLGAELGLHLFFSTAKAEEGGGAVTTDTGADALFQLGGEVAYQTHTTRSGVWVRLAAVMSGELGDDGDRTQLSLEPYLRFGVTGAFLRAALTVNVDEPFGFSFSGDPLDVWGLHVGGGTQF